MFDISHFISGKSCSARQVVYPVYQKDNQRDQMAPCYQQNTLRDMAALAATSAAAAVVSATGAKSLLGNVCGIVC